MERYDIFEHEGSRCVGILPFLGLPHLLQLHCAQVATDTKFRLWRAAVRAFVRPAPGSNAPDHLCLHEDTAAAGRISPV